MIKEEIIRKLRHRLRRLKTSIKWIFCGIASGFLVGGIGTFFHFCMAAVTGIYMEHNLLIGLLPLGGLLIAAAYHLLRDPENRGTSMVLSSIHSGEELPLRMAPLIFFSTLITHLFGGSSGREGAALQLGGSIGNSLGKIFRFDEQDKCIMVMSGMSAAFSALFGTPMAAAVFSIEVASVGIMHYVALVPCVIAALIAGALADYFGVEEEAFPLRSVPAFTVESAIRISVLAILCAMVSILFCIVLHRSEELYHKFFKNSYLRIFAGGCIVVALTLLTGSQEYNGSGIAGIGLCMEGKAPPEAFLLKMIFTAATLGAGYKGGEIVPSLYIGAAFGGFLGTLTGFSPALCAAVGMTAVFCGVTNCPIASLLISFELFGYAGMPYFLLAVAFGYMLSGYHGLYHGQKIMYSKYRSVYINKDAE